ncbi:ataxin-2 homolog [Toxorhynchites rutilus septentrionalis]|uniref:ataxin-2 homolog n=1 Tax=Toxorhynchites rutilus septentrionalis TaxID=329112 RepID=UPI00247A5CA7|nr:ataxin-2 homolog [Toxorhynchites rutilus septentrionalis]
MSEKPAQKLSESDDFTDNSVDNANDAAREDTSQQSGLATVESEYDTASDSPSDGEEYDEQEDETDSGEEEELGTDAEDDDEGEDADDGSDDDVIEVLDYERQSGDGQEQEADSKRKVDDDEDRSNPQYIPKKGTFYEHDDRTVEDDDEGKEADNENATNEDSSGPTGDRKGVDKTTASKTMKKWQASADRWTHDRFDESEQAPKSRAELVSAYGYDIRSEDGPPRARRRRRYARGPNKYTRNWEDEDAYSKSNNPEHNRQRKPPRPEEFPELGSNNTIKMRNTQNTRRASKQSRSSVGDQLDERSTGGRQRSERRTSDRNRVNNSSRSSGAGPDRERGMERERGDRYEQQRDKGERLDRERDRDRNWDRDRDYDQQQDVNGRDYRTDGSRYSVERVSNNNNNNYHNKENKISGRNSKEKERRGSDYKVITSLQFKNTTRNRTSDVAMPVSGGGANQIAHSNSSGALSGSSNSNKMNNAMDRVPPVPERNLMDQRAAAVQHHYQNQPPQLIQQAQIPPPQAHVQQQPQPAPQQQQQPIQHHPQQSTYVNDDHYDSYSDSKMPKDAKFPYNPPANATIQSVEIGQTDIAKYPPPIPQRTSKDRQQVLPATTAVALNTRSQISPRQIVSTQANQLTSISTTQQLAHQQQQQQIQQQTQQQYQQLQQQQAQYQQQLHTLASQGASPVTAQAPQTQVPPPQLPQQAPAQLAQQTTAQLHNVHLGGALANTAVSQQQLLPNDSGSRSSKRYSNLRQRSTLDNPGVVVVQSALHEQQQQQLLQQQQQQQLLLQQELQHQQQQKLTTQAPKQPPYQLNQPPQQPSLPLNLPNEYLVQTANQASSSSKPQSASQASVQYQHAAAYYTATTPTGSDFVAGTTSQPVPPPTVSSVPQPQNPLLSAPQYPQYTQPNSGTHQYIQAPPPAAYIPQPNATPQPTPQPATAAPPPQIMNYVPSITSAAQAPYPAAPFASYQNFNAVVPQPVAPAVVPHTPSPSAAAAALFQSSGGITYYAPQSQTQAPRPLPSQRRPTSAIPILAPPDRKQKNNRSGTDSSGNSINESDENNAGSNGGANAPIGSAENIDHILDNMFVQRPPYQPPTRKSPSPAPPMAAANAVPTSGTVSSTSNGGSNVDAGSSTAPLVADVGKETDKETIEMMGESVKNLTIQEEQMPIVDPIAPSVTEKLELTQTVAPVDPTAG